MASHELYKYINEEQQECKMARKMLNVPSIALKVISHSVLIAIVTLAFTQTQTHSLTFTMSEEEKKRIEGSS